MQWSALLCEPDFPEKEGKSNPDDEDERKLKRQRRSNPTGNLLIDPDCASRSCSAFGYPRSACVDYAFRPLARCKEACHDKTVSQTCCNQEHDGSRSEQHALRTPIAGDLPGYNDLDTYVALLKSYMRFRSDFRNSLHLMISRFKKTQEILLHALKSLQKAITRLNQDLANTCSSNDRVLGSISMSWKLKCMNVWIHFIAVRNVPRAVLM
ncbi:hypothetical protein Tco_0765410 [Tanacetum coccineum]